MYRSGSLRIGFPLQPLVIIDCHAAGLQCRHHAPLLLLHHMPGFMCQMLFLPWPYMDVSPLGVRQCLHLGRFGGMIVNLYVIHGYAGDAFNPRFQGIR